MRALLLGEAPSRGGDRYWRFPLSGSPARVLCSAAGIPPVKDAEGPGRWTWALYDHFECRNVFRRYADATPWSVPRARELAGELDLEGRVVVALGRKVAAAVGAPAFHDWLESDGAQLTSVPHPSGLNRVLNDPAERDALGATLRRALLLAAQTGDPVVR